MTKYHKAGWWKKKFWETFTQYIKKRDNYTCITCGRVGEGKGIHGGHYIPKSVCGLKLYFDERNVNAQCFKCNINLGGNGRMYERAMIKKYGQKEVDDLDRIYNESHSKPFKISDEEYENLIEIYKQKINQL